MARPVSDEEVQLKRRARRRLIGAVVLVTAVVVALPMVLDNEPKPVGGEVTIRIPPPDSAFTSRVIPVAPGSAEPAAKLSTEMRSAPPPTPTPAPAERKAAPPTEEKKAITKLPEPAAPPVRSEPAAPAREAPKAAPAPVAPKSAPASAPAASGFVVQVIALADAAKAKEVQAQIAAAGIKAYTEVVRTAKGDVTRVRAGPFPSRAAAEKARDQLKTIGLNGNVVPK